MPITRTVANSKQSSPKASTSNDDILALIKTLKEEISSSNKSLSDSLSKKFNELKLEFQRVSKQVSELKTSYAALYSEVDDLKGKVAKLECSSPLVNSQSIVSQVLQENFEHERCLPNLIVYGVPESNSPDTSVRIDHDKRTVSSSLGSLENAVPDKYKLIRLGRSRADFTRPIKIICESKDAASNLFSAYNSAKRSGKPFPEGFRMSRDRTTLQRKLLRTCYEDLERRVKSGETGLRVVFVNGFPTVGSALSKNGDGRFISHANQS